MRAESATSISIRSQQVQFKEASPARLVSSVLKGTYTVKPLVLSLRGESVFGEIAVLEALENDGWAGVWVDTFHGNKFWDSMPTGRSVGLPYNARRRFEQIVSENDGRTAGFFDIMAWREDSFLFAEYKGPGDKSNKNEATWISAAMRSGVPLSQLLFVTYDAQ